MTNAAQAQRWNGATGQFGVRRCRFTDISPEPLAEELNVDAEDAVEFLYLDTLIEPLP